MESAKLGKLESGVFCPLHPDHPLHAVNMVQSEGKDLVCLQCISQQKNISKMSSLKTFTDLIQTVSEVYTIKREGSKCGEKPKEYEDLLLSQDEIIEKLNRHIEEEKKGITEFFTDLIQMIVEIINQKKTEYIKQLDQQMIQLQEYFVDFDQQLKRAFPTEEEIASLYPTQQALENQFRDIKEFDQLSKFVTGLKKDCPSEDFAKENDEKALLESLSNKILALEDLKPEYPKFDQASLEDHFKKEYENFFKQKVILKNPIPNYSELFAPKSSIAALKDWSKIEKLLPAVRGGTPKLIYKSRRDGSDPASFHRHCDGKSNTVTFFVFKGKSEHIFGGYLDAAWHSRNAFISSKNAVLFYLNALERYPISYEYRAETAAYGGSECGPAFGWWENDYGTETYILQKGKASSEFLSDVGFPLKAEYHSFNFEFECSDIEVYTFD